MNDFVKDDEVLVHNPAESRGEVLRLLSERAVELGIARDADAVLDAYHKREEEGATGMMDGFAIPHAKCDAIGEPAVIVVKLERALEWPSFDDKAVDVVISLLVPEAQAGTTHLRLLSKTAVMLMDDDFRDEVRATDDAHEIASLINARLEA